MTALNQPHFQNADNVREYLQALRWPNGPICPHCGSISKDHYELQGKAHRPGLYKCKDCREQFTVTVGTVFERSKIKLNVWLQAAFLMCASKKGISSHQLHRTLGVTYKTAWFMTHRIREAMKDDGGILGGGGKIVEVDETYVGRKPGRKIARGAHHKLPVLSLVERQGKARSIHVANVRGNTLKEHVDAHLAKDSHMRTDEYRPYVTIGREYASHETVNHGLNSYVRPGGIHTNTVEGFFSIFKRGVIGTYQHISDAHLQRYLQEFDFRYNNRTALGVDDAQRTATALKQIGGKRLMYKRAGQSA